jgi:hypothetical protein
MDPAQHRPEVLPSSAPASEPRDERPSHDAIWGWHFLHDSDKVCGLHRYASWMVDAERPLWDWLCDEAEARCCGDAARGRAVDERTWAAIAARRAEMREVACDWTAIRSSAREAAEIAGTLAAWEAVRVIEGSSLRGHKLGVSAARQWVGGDHPGVRVPSS